MVLYVKATPNAKQSQIVGWEIDALVGRVLRVRIAAPPTEGKANKELVRFLAKYFALSPSSVSLEKGTSSRLKKVNLPIKEIDLLQICEKN